MPADPSTRVLGAHLDRMIDLERAEDRCAKKERSVNEAMEILNEILWSRRCFELDHRNLGCEAADLLRAESDSRNLFAQVKAGGIKLLEDLDTEQRELARKREVNEQRVRDELRVLEAQERERWRSQI